MSVSTAAGAKFYIGTTAASGATDTYTEISDVLSISEFGRVYNEVTYSPLSTRGVEKIKGSYNDGGVDLSLGRNTSNAGQSALRVALDIDSDYNFKYEPNDKVAPVSIVATITIAVPGIVSWTAHGFAAGTPISFTTTGALPTGLVAGTTYYVTSGATLLTNSFALSSSLANSVAGTAITTSGTQSGVHTASTVPLNSYQLMKGKVLSYTNNNGTIDSIIGAMAKISLKSGSIVETNKNPLV